jgi:hypothetical protein
MSGKRNLYTTGGGGGGQQLNIQTSYKRVGLPELPARALKVISSFPPNPNRLLEEAVARELGVEKGVVAAKGVAAVKGVVPAKGDAVDRDGVVESASPTFLPKRDCFGALKYNTSKTEQISGKMYCSKILLYIRITMHHVWSSY